VPILPNPVYLLTQILPSASHTHVRLRIQAHEPTTVTGDDTETPQIWILLTRHVLDTRRPASEYISLQGDWEDGVVAPATVETVVAKVGID
jgi:hypothetical protein